MKDRVDRFVNGFKNGVLLWIVAYFLLYAVGLYAGDNSTYNAEIMKLLDVKNFITQVIVAGITYIALDLVFTKYFNDILEIFSLNQNSKKRVVKDIVAIIVILVVLLPTLKYIKEVGVVNKAIMKLIVGLMILKAMIFSISQMVNTYIYNKKLQEKNKE